MQYKTIALELLREHPQLRSATTQLKDMNRLAMLLKTNHRTWMDQIRQRKPRSSEEQISSEALEIALDELLLSSASALSAVGTTDAPRSPDTAMAWLTKHSPTG